MKGKRSLLITLLICMLTVSMMIAAGCGNSKADAKKNAEEFLKATYEVKDYKQLDDFQAFITSEKLDENLINDANADGSNKFREKLDKLYYGDTLDLISEKLKKEETLVADRMAPLSIEMKAKFGNYTTEVKSIDLKERDGATDTEVNYDYTLALEVKNSDGTTSEEEKLGSINMIKENGKWFVNYLKSAN